MHHTVHSQHLVKVQSVGRFLQFNKDTHSKNSHGKQFVQFHREISQINSRHLSVKIYNNKNKVDISASVLAGVIAGAVTQSVVAGSGGSVSYISPRSTWTPDTRDRNTENFSAASGLCLGVNRNVSLERLLL